MNAKPDISVHPTTFGYARVSSQDQNLARQLDSLTSFGVALDHIFTDKMSGKNFDRPAYKALMNALATDDTLVIASIDRLGRNYDEILKEWRHITKDMGVSVVVLDMPLLDTRNSNGDLTGTFIADLVLQLLSYVAQLERDHIRQRQAEGIAAAHARGKKFGRPRRTRPPKATSVLKETREGAITRREAAARLGISTGTLYRWLKEDELATNAPPCKD